MLVDDDIIIYIVGRKMFIKSLWVLCGCLKYSIKNYILCDCDKY